MTPIEMLKKELCELERALEKSEELYENKAILKSTHLVHKCNLLPKITEYKSAILILTTYDERTAITKTEKAS